MSGVGAVRLADPNGPKRTLGTSPPLTEVSRALRARNAEKVSKMSPGTPKSIQRVSVTVWEVSRESLESVSRVFLDPKKYPKSFGDSLGSLQRVSGKCLESVFGVFRDFLETFGGPEAGGPGRHFREFFGISGPEGPRDLCKGRADSQDAPPKENMLVSRMLKPGSEYRVGQFDHRVL